MGSEFSQLFNDFFLSQIDTHLARGSNELDFVITSIPNQVKIREIIPSVMP